MSKRANRIKPTGRIALTILLGASIAGAGCAGAQGRFNFAELSYPVSMTSVLPGVDGRLLKKDRELRVIKEVEYRFSRYASCYTLGASDAPDGDPAMGLNRLIRAAGGVGMVDTTIENQSCAWNYVIPFSLLPFWIGCTHTYIRGKIVGLSGR